MAAENIIIRCCDGSVPKNAILLTIPINSRLVGNPEVIQESRLAIDSVALRIA
jgi:hypothetical protein